MVRRLTGVLVLACALMALVVATAAAEGEPAGPRLTFTRSSDSRFELVSADPAGQDQRVIAGGTSSSQPLPFPFSLAAWSRDGAQVVFSGLTHTSFGTQIYLYEAGADGRDLTKIPHTWNAVYPVLSPDGHTLAFARQREREGRRPHRGEATVFDGISIWLLNLESGELRQLTPWRNGLFDAPSSFSPDGSTLAISEDRRRHRDHASHSAIALRLDGSGSALLAREASEPVYSPDGSRIALIATGKTTTSKSPKGSTTITATELAVANADGSGLTKLTHTRAVELEPSWDPSGQRLAYTQLRGGRSESDILGIGDSIMEINADGSCRTRVLSYSSRILFGATWQPGPGREAGPIAC